MRVLASLVALASSLNTRRAILATPAALLFPQPSAADASPSHISRAIDAAWTRAHGTRQLAALYTPDALVISASADSFTPASAFAAAEAPARFAPLIFPAIKGFAQNAKIKI